MSSLRGLLAKCLPNESTHSGLIGSTMSANREEEQPLFNSLAPERFRLRSRSRRMAYQSDSQRPRNALAEDAIRQKRHAARREVEDRRRREREAARRRATNISALSLLIVAVATAYVLARLIMDHI